MALAVPKVHIHQHQLHGGRVATNLPCSFRFFSQHHLVIVALKDEFQREAYGFIVIYYEYHGSYLWFCWCKDTKKIRIKSEESGKSFSVYLQFLFLFVFRHIADHHLFTSLQTADHLDVVVVALTQPHLAWQ